MPLVSGWLTSKLVEFAVGWQVDAGLALDVKDYARRVCAGLLAG